MKEKKLKDREKIITISKGILMDNGYVEYNTNKFQKKFVDKIGIKYFIECDYYECHDFCLWTFKMQLNTKHGAVDFETVQWFNDSQNKTLKDVEDYFQWLWEIHEEPYYELYYD